MSKCGVFPGPYFPVFGLNTEIYSVNLCIQCKYGKMRTRKNCAFRHFLRSALPDCRNYSKFNTFRINRFVSSFAWFEYFQVHWKALNKEEYWCQLVNCAKNKVFHEGKKSAKNVNLLTFTKEISYRKVNFLCRGLTVINRKDFDKNGTKSLT